MDDKTMCVCACLWCVVCVVRGVVSCGMVWCLWVCGARVCVGVAGFAGISVCMLWVAWRDVAWRGVAWRGVFWRGVAWRDVARLGGVWCGMRCVMLWCGVRVVCGVVCGTV